MKKFLFLVTVFCLGFSAQGQENFLFTIHAVHIEGDLDAFEKVESMYMQRVAQAAVDKGDIMGWSLNKSIFLDNINDEENFNYVFVQSAKNIKDIVSSKAAWWSSAGDILSAKEQEEVAELQKKFSWKKDVKVLYHVESALWDSNYDGTVVFQFNFAKPKNSNGFIEENKTLWRPFFEANNPKLNMVGWGVASKVHPLGEEWSDVVTWDAFKNLEDLYQYRIGVEGINPPSDKSNMQTYNPDGFSNSPIYMGIATTKN